MRTKKAVIMPHIKKRLYIFWLSDMPMFWFICLSSALQRYCMSKDFCRILSLLTWCFDRWLLKLIKKSPEKTLTKNERLFLWLYHKRNFKRPFFLAPGKTNMLTKYFFVKKYKNVFAPLAHRVNFFQTDLLFNEQLINSVFFRQIEWLLSRRRIKQNLLGSLFISLQCFHFWDQFLIF